MRGRDNETERRDKSSDLPNEREKFHSNLDDLVVLPLAGEKLPCAVAERCGGCPEFASTLVEQRRHKGQMLLTGLAARSIPHPGGVEWLVAKTTAYRNRIRLALRDGVPSYFNREKDRQCAVLEPEVLHALARFESWAAPRRGVLANYCVAEVRMADADHKASVYLRHTQRNGLALPPPDWSLLPTGFGEVLLAVEGGPVRLQRYLVTDSVYAKVPIGGFMQINASANRLMVERVVEWAQRLCARRCLDLFAGSGNFALPLARAGSEVLAIECDLAACQALEIASGEQLLTKVNVSVGDALTRARELALAGETYDLVVADPPRGGLRGDVEALCTMAKTAIVLVSCDVERFCRDASALNEQGLVLSECVAVDMFPHTRHTEVLGLFLRRNPRADWTPPVPVGASASLVAKNLEKAIEQGGVSPENGNLQ